MKQNILYYTTLYYTSRILLYLGVKKITVDSKLPSKFLAFTYLIPMLNFFFNNWKFAKNLWLPKTEVVPNLMKWTK